MASTGRRRKKKKIVDKPEEARISVDIEQRSGATQAAIPEEGYLAVQGDHVFVDESHWSEKRLDGGRLDSR